MAVTRAKLYDENGLTVTFDVLNSESVSRSATVTDRQVEDGSTISDNVNYSPLEASIDGRMTQDAYNNLRQLISFYDNASLLTYIGRNGITKVLISSLDTDHPRENIGGFDFTMTLKQIRITQTQTVEVVAPAYIDTSSDTDSDTTTLTASTTDAGTQSTTDSGVDSGTEAEVEETATSLSSLQSISDYLTERGY